MKVIEDSLLAGGGEMGVLIRSFDWSKTSVGSPDTWSQSLITTLSILLNSKFPMLLWWGEDHIQFYNDAYLPSIVIDGKHPKALGQKGEDCWPETWPIIKPMIDELFRGGEASLNEDQLIPIYRNEKLEDLHWTLRYSPLQKENGKIGGVLVTIIETAEKVKNFKKLADSNDELNFAIEAAELGTWDFNPVTYRFTGNNRLKDWFGLPHEAEIELSSAIEVIIEEDRKRVTQAIEKALQYESGGLYDIDYSIINAVTKQQRFVRAKGRSWFGDNKKAYRFNGTLQDVTKETIARKKIEETELLLSNERLMIYNAFMNAPAGIAILKDDKHIYEFANAAYEKLANIKITIGKTFQELFPEMEEQGLIDMLDTVFYTGEPFIANELPIVVKDKTTGKLVLGYYNIVVHPLKDDNGNTVRLLSHTVEVTQQVEARKQIEASHQRFGAAIEAVQGILWTNNAIGEMEAEQPGWAALTGQSYEEYKGHGWTTAVHPDDAEPTIAAWNEAVNESKTFVFEHRVKTKSGQWELFSIKAIPLLNDDGSIREWIGVHTNITEEKETEERIKESEAKFRTLSETIPLMVWTATPDGKKNFFNHYYLDYTGLSFEELKGAGMKKIIFPDDLQKDLQLWHHSLKTGEDFKMEKRLRRHDGTYRWHLSHGIAQKDEQGNVIGWVGSNTEIEEQKKSAEELEIKVKERTVELFEKEEYLHQIVSNAPDAVIVINEKNIITLWNPKTEEIFGWKEEEVLGLNLTDIIVPMQYREAHREGMKRFLKTGVARVLNKTLELTALNREGKEFDISLTISQANQHGEKLFIAFLRDVTIEKQNQEQLIIKSKQLEEVNESLEIKNIELEKSNAELASFSYVASHDLQEPLRKIQTFGKLIIEREKFSEKTEDYFNRIISASERMQNLIISLLNFSSTSTTNLIFVACDLNEIVEESKDNLQLIITEKHAVIEYENLPTLHASHVQLSQLFTNLIENAIKYSRAGIIPHIKITASIVEGKKIEHPSSNNHKKYHAIKIADNGIGFEKEYANKIFELFQRLHHKTEYSGTGIGLAIVKKVVTNHHGFILVEGKPNVGSTFTVYIPTA